VKTVLITGITGQDGAYLTEVMLRKGYKVIGAHRRSSSANFWRLQWLGVLDNPNLELVEFDLTDLSSLIRLVRRHKPDEIYNLAAQTHVGVSFDQPITTAQITALGALNMLEAVRITEIPARIFQAASSEMFGKVRETPQNENTPFHPRSPYGVAKTFAYWSAINYREAHGMYVATGILFNHESPLRGLNFVTRKITSELAKIMVRNEGELILGNLDAVRDWGYAPEYVEGYWQALQAVEPDDFVFATGTCASVREFASMAFQNAGVELHWQGAGMEERGVCRKTGRTFVRLSSSFTRQAEVDLLVGDPSKAKRLLSWSAQTPLDVLCRLMVEADLRSCKQSLAGATEHSAVV
jgi:GDPmannose 4,6-dehydratase